MTQEIISRAEAKSASLTFYFTGVACRNGHLCERYVSTRTCVKCQMEHCQRGRAKSPEDHRAKRRAQIAKNPEQHRAAFHRWREKNISEDSARNRAWRMQNPQKQRAKEMRRRAAKVRAVPSWYGEFDEFVITEAIELVRIRGALTGFEWHVDHCIPLRAEVACGLHCAANIQVIPANTNASKGNRMVLTEPGEWLAFL